MRRKEGTIVNHMPRLGRIALIFVAGLAALAVGTTTVTAAPDSVSVGYQPMTVTGLAAGHGFEAWFMLDKATDPAGRQPGTAEVEAKLDGGTSTILRLIVEP